MQLEDLVVPAETAEAAGNAALFHAASPQLKTEMGIEVREIAEATCWSTRSLDRQFANGVIGLGLRQPATQNALGEIDELYGDSGVDYAIHVAPGAMPGELSQWLRDRGFRIVHRAVKCWRPVAGSPRDTSDLWVQQIGRANADEFVRVALHDFDMGDLAEALRSVVGARGWRHYLAFHDSLPIASAAMYLHEGTAWLGWAYTLPEYRRRGAQSALLARRVRDAADRGCHMVVAETGEETSESPNRSLRNMLRTGFRVAYVKDVYGRGL